MLYHLFLNKAGRFNDHFKQRYKYFEKDNIYHRIPTLSTIYFLINNLIVMELIYNLFCQTNTFLSPT
jgi:hypothetical protein